MLSQSQILLEKSNVQYQNFVIGIQIHCTVYKIVNTLWLIRNLAIVHQTAYYEKTSQAIKMNATYGLSLI